MLLQIFWTLLMIIRIIRLFVFIRFFLRPDCPDSCGKLVSMIRGAGIGAIKAAQWHFNIFRFKCEAHPILMDHIRLLQSQNSGRPLDDETIEGIMQRVPSIATIDPIPFASGSIAQIHSCTDDEGRRCVLKVRHPNVESEIASYRFVVWVLSVFVDMTDARALLDIVLPQTDLAVEGENAMTMRRLYHDSSHIIRIPMVYHASPGLLLMEHLPVDAHGDEINDPDVIILLLSWVMDQVLHQSIYHADLHYGNWGYNASEGYIAVYDWGFVLASENVRSMAASIVCRRKEDCYESLCRCMGTEVPVGGFDGAWRMLEDHNFVMTMPVMERFMETIGCVAGLSPGVLNAFTFLLGLTCVDKIAHLQQNTDHVELHKHQHVVLAKKRVMPMLRAFLRQKILCG